MTTATDTKPANRKTGADAPAAEHPKIQQRRRRVSNARRRQKLRRRLLFPLATLLLAGLALWLVFFSQFLDVNRAQVEGLERISAEQVAELTDQLLGDPLLILNADQLRHNLLNLPWVKDVSISKSWRHGVLHVSILEREPVAVIAAATGTGSEAAAPGYLLLDIEGRVLQTVPDPGAFLVINGVSVGEPTADSAAPAVIEAARPPLLVAEALDRHPQLRGRVVTILVSEGKLFLELAGQTWVYLNDTRDLDAKLTSARTLLNTALLNCGEVLDVNSPATPVIRPGNCQL